MIWKKHRVMICACALFALSLLSSVFIHSSVSALDTGLVNRTQTNVEKVVRTSWGTDNIEYNTSIGAQNLPWLALGANDGSRTYRYLWGMLLYNDLTSYNYAYEDYTSITVTIRFGGAAGRHGGIPECPGPSDSCLVSIVHNTSLVIYDDHNESKEVSCSGYAREEMPNDWATIITCSANFETGHNPVGYHIKIKPLDSVQLGVNPNYTLGIGDTDNVAVTHIGQQIISDTDPLKALLREGNIISQDVANNTQNIYDITNNYYLQEGQDRADLQDASNDASQDGSNAQSQAQSATSNIIGAITGIYTTLLSPTTTNCTLENVNLYGQLNLGNLDFCTLTMPQPFFTIGAIGCIGIVILLAWSVLRAGMSLYNDLLGGKS